MAILTNLHNEQFDPVIEIRKKWTISLEELEKIDDWIDITYDRTFLKRVIMLSIYGSSTISIINDIQEDYKKIDFGRMQKGWKGLSQAIQWAIRNVKNTFNLLFEFNSWLVSNSNLKEIEMTWQKNTSNYCYYKNHDIRLDISKLYKNEITELTPKEDNDMLKSTNLDKAIKEKKLSHRLQLNWTDYNLYDKGKNKKTILTGIIHSLDAEIATTLRFRMFTKYNSYVYSIHDCFACEGHLIEEIKVEYKNILFEKVFNKKLSDIIKVKSEIKDYSTFETIISKNKQDLKWLSIKESYSHYCLKLE